MTFRTESPFGRSVLIFFGAIAADKGISIAKEIQTFLEFPPMQRGTSFNLDALNAEMAAAAKMQQAEKAAKGSGRSME